MSNKRYTDRQLKKKFGMRPTDGIPIDFPQELGYRCPKGHSNLIWSEFKEHIWCYKCKRDFHYAQDCVLIKNKHMPKNLPQQPRIIKDISNYDKTGNFFINISKERLYAKD